MTSLSVSVILPVRNGAPFLAEAIQSVLAQSLPVKELIVVDGQSTDGSREIAASFPGVAIHAQQGNGLSNAWNQGIRTAQSELIAFIDSDDRWVPEKVEQQVAYFHRHVMTQYVTGRVKFFLAEGQTVPTGFKPKLLEGDHLGRIPGTLMARKSLFDQVGDFDPSWQLASDVDWFTRCQTRGIEAGVLNEVLLEKRIHSANLTVNAELNQRELLRVLARSVKERRAALPTRPV